MLPAQGHAFPCQACHGAVSKTWMHAGIVQRQWVWLLLFAPLWGTLFVSFGIGPVVSRTDDPLPVLQNTGAFLAAAAIFRLSPLFKQSAIDTSILKRSAQEGRDDSRGD